MNEWFIKLISIIKHFNGIIDTVVCVEGIYQYSRDEGMYAELEAVILSTQVRQNVHFGDDWFNGSHKGDGLNSWSDCTREI